MKKWIKIYNQYTCPCCDAKFKEGQIHVEEWRICPACATPLWGCSDASLLGDVVERFDAAHEAELCGEEFTGQIYAC